MVARLEVQQALQSVALVALVAVLIQYAFTYLFYLIFSIYLALKAASDAAVTPPPLAAPPLVNASITLPTLEECKNIQRDWVHLHKLVENLKGELMCLVCLETAFEPYVSISL
ncbi:hypothetical protein GYMLUDRAFT_63873 [Collybiopsis luxurians FD-317 M1]|uniref:Uncharacterized protein n=1 Tax=Collybiopsis luxurians FD-317 M1 TaxID=944289 RepID=A0A0D0C5J9_9AGAR|nr:hypothetical protein GYMLUDRAFT_63873 [Collybiopsis luxurians FD-317 M1]